MGRSCSAADQGMRRLLHHYGNTAVLSAGGGLSVVGWVGQWVSIDAGGTSLPPRLPALGRGPYCHIGEPVLNLKICLPILLKSTCELNF